MVTKLGMTILNITSFSNNAFEIEELTPEGQILRVNGKYLKRYRPMLQEIMIDMG